MYKIYKKNNYLIIDDGATTPEEYLTKDILIKEIVTNVTYDIYGILPRLGNTSNQLLYTVNIANIIKETILLPDFTELYSLKNYHLEELYYI